MASSGSGSHLSSGFSISRHVSIIVDELAREGELADEQNMPLPEPDEEMNDFPLEVDDDDDEDDRGQTESLYAASHYPVIPIRYRVERFDAATM